MLSRRMFLGSAVASAALFGGARPGLAQSASNGRRFLFLSAEGGWDPLAVFAPMFSSNEIQMEPNTAPWSVGGLDLVDHPDRPTTRAFFDEHARDIALLHGISTRSVNHETCQIVALTGATSAERPDFATLLAHAERETTSLPHLVVSGPSFPGRHTVIVSNAQGLLQETIDGTLLTESDRPLRVPASEPSRLVDDYLRRRSEMLSERFGALTHAVDYHEAQRRVHELVETSAGLNLRSKRNFVGRVETAISALAAGLCRCASVGTDFIWDSHTDNGEQTGNFENFFADLDAVLESLATTIGPDGQPLSQTTVVVVTSEMARTPAYNSTGGRDHWPYTSMMMMGPGINVGRSFGGYTNLYTGIGVAPDGGLDPNQAGISAESLGATLLMLGDVDPQEHLRGALPIPGVIA